MKVTFSQFKDLAPDQVPDTPEAFLALLAGPASLWITGQDSSRTRAVVTLLHGNEPSGLKAVHRLLKEGFSPLTNLLILLGSTEAARLEPRFRNRFYPGTRDMNRCFNPPFEDEPGQIARQILERLERQPLEAVIDLHNTSGTSPSFGVVTREDPRHERLVGLFTEKLVVTELRLGSLMEQSREDRPAITVECGGAQDALADQVAYRGLVRFATEPELFEAECDLDLDLYHHPVRLELEQGTRLAFADQPALGVELTLLSQVDRLNFQSVPTGTLLGWVRDESVKSRLRVMNSSGQNRFADYFELCGNRLQTLKPLKLFMVTTRPDIALSDCLLYAAFESEHETVHLHIDPVT